MNGYSKALAKPKLKAAASFIGASIAMQEAFGYVPGGIWETLELAREFRDLAKQDAEIREMLERCEALYKTAARVPA